MSFYAKLCNASVRTKKQAELAHAKRRALLRFNIDLTPKLRAEILDKIRQQGQTLIIEQRSLRVTTHMMTVLGQLVLVVYDKQRHEIVTFMKPRRQHIAFARKNKDKLQF